MPQIIDKVNGYNITIPYKTPSNQKVSINLNEMNTTHKILFKSPDLSELYFEITCYSTNIALEILIGEIQSFLKTNAKDARIGDVKEEVINHYNALIFDFVGFLQGMNKNRRFLFINTPKKTYRIVYDFTSGLNEKVLESLFLE